MDKNEYKIWIAFWICIFFAWSIVPSISSTIIQIEKIKNNCAVEEVVKDE